MKNDDAYCDCYENEPPDRPEPDPPERGEDDEARTYRHPYPNDLHPSYDLDLW